ncbi:hypothetical protein [Streptomyces sp. NPDC002215]|uniref:hypothetical protein n=1 Tax=Streptomyces sp. NPDC002215 TaxID=3154412 RepID=UPI003326C16D
MCDVRLEWLAAEVMGVLPSAEARAAVQALLVDVAGHPDWWPAPGGEIVFGRLEPLQR